MPQMLVLCAGCAQQHIDEHGEPDKFLLAMFGPQGMEDEDGILVCGLWEEYSSNLFYQLVNPGAQLFLCDGCQTEVTVSRSSAWFVEQQREQLGL